MAISTKSAGLSEVQAASRLGVPRSTLLSWRKRGLLRADLLKPGNPLDKRSTLLYDEDLIDDVILGIESVFAVS